MTRVLLAMLLFQAYVPVGFMPASGTPFLLELCPAAMPMSMSVSVSMPTSGQHHHHPSGPTHNEFQNCPFGSAPASGPIAHLIAFAPPPPIASHTLAAVESVRISERVNRAHPPRGPPSLTFG